MFVSQQLCNEGSSEVYLPSWSGIGVISGDNKKKDSPNDGEFIEQQHVSKDDPTAVTGQSTNNESSRVNADPEDLTYSNIEGVHISMSTSTNGTDNESKLVNVNPEDLTYSNIENVQSAMNASTNAESQVLQMSPGRERAPECIYEIAPPPASPSKPCSPSKPKPYSVSKKEKSGRTRCVGAEKPEGTILKQVVSQIANFVYCTFMFAIQNYFTLFWPFNKIDHVKMLILLTWSNFTVFFLSVHNVQGYLLQFLFPSSYL